MVGNFLVVRSLLRFLGFGRRRVGVRVGFGHRDGQLVLELPEEGAELSGKCHDDLVLMLAAGLEFHVALVKTILHSPRQIPDLFVLPLLALAQSLV